MSLELKRNKELRGYRSSQAHQLLASRKLNYEYQRINEEQWQRLETLIGALNNAVVG